MTYVIQHSDRNASRADYKHLVDKLLITKVWYTLQGEGPYAGVPAVFVRLAGCNRGDKESMGCAYCDTSFELANGMALDYKAIEDQMTSVLHRQTHTSDAVDFPLVVITGGEPMLQDNLVGFLEYLGRNKWHNIQIESNGDRLAKGFLESKWCETVELVVSPKATTHGYRALAPDVLRRLNYLKCLIDSREAPYTEPPAYVVIKDPHAVFLSPITVYKQQAYAGTAVGFTNTIDADYTKQNYARAAMLALQFGYRVSMQQHLFFGVP